MKLEELKKIAEAATPGPWGWCYDGSSDWSVGPKRDPQGKGRIGIYRPGAVECPDAEFISTFSPSTVLILLKLLQRYTKASREVLDFFGEQAKEQGRDGVPIVLLDLANVTHQVEALEGGGERAEVERLKAEVKTLRALVIERTTERDEMEFQATLDDRRLAGMLNEAEYAFESAPDDRARGYFAERISAYRELIARRKALAALRRGEGG